MGILLCGLSAGKSKFLCVQALPLMTTVVVLESFFLDTSLVFLGCGGDVIFSFLLTACGSIAIDSVGFVSLQISVGSVGCCAVFSCSCLSFMCLVQAGFPGVHQFVGSEWSLSCGRAVVVKVHVFRNCPLFFILLCLLSSIFSSVDLRFIA